VECFLRCPSPLGSLTLTAEDGFLTGLFFDRADSPPPACPPAPCALPPVLISAQRWLDAYFAGEIPAFTPPLRLEGTPFQRRVWSMLLEIPYGETMTYGSLAARIARERGLRRMSAQAVGQAVGRNPISLIVPCHRVVGAGGSLTGYGGGLDRKARLLQLEQSVILPSPLPDSVSRING